MMTSAEIRQSFLDFFRSKQHTLVPSASLLPDSPNLLFTNAGMNQFVPIFLGQRKADVSGWAGATPGLDTRAADTQKCIRAGGKHNDLEDVGLDTYHHTFFEMLGNWSFGDYFKEEAIAWAWELITEVWRFPKERLYVTVYRPGEGDPAAFDQEAYDHWAKWFAAAGLDPQAHVLSGSKKDNFWMMGDTGPCGPCSEIHMDLTPGGDAGGAFVNQGRAECIEIWNLVFIQFNANPDGSFSPLPARHVDTGMGFERVAGIMQGTRQFADFSQVISNYETDVFRPLFDQLEKLSGRKYRSTLPRPDAAGRLVPRTEQEKIDVAFRVIADHIRTVSCSAADGILPGNKDRNYVLRRILRRAVRYGRSLGFQKPFFYQLVSVVAETLGEVFPELAKRQAQVTDALRREEETFNATLDRGLELFREEVDRLPVGGELPGGVAFRLFDEQGFPLDLTGLMARELGLTVDLAGYEALMEQQKRRSQEAQKKTVIEVSNVTTQTPTAFVGFEQVTAESEVLEVVRVQGRAAVVLALTPFYAEMGGQVGDAGVLMATGEEWRVAETRKTGETWLHFLGDTEASPTVGQQVRLSVDVGRRAAIQRHHTVTHLLHWALHEVVGPDAAQKGSYVGPDKLTFDFNSAPLTAQQVADIERLVNERVLENAPVTWLEADYDQVKHRSDIMQFFGEKYGERVRVVQIGGQPDALDGYSMELCGGTHCRATGEVGLFRVGSEGAIAAGIRRIEATSGLEAYRWTLGQSDLLRSISGRVNAPLGELERKIENILSQQKELERQLKSLTQERAAGAARALAKRAREVGGVALIAEDMGETDGDLLQAMANELKGSFRGVVVLAGTSGGSVVLMATVSRDLTSRIQAGKIIQQIAPIVGGRGGGRPDYARGGGKEVARVREALAAVDAMLA